MKWSADPGHGGYDPGAVGSRGAKESGIVLDIAFRWKRYMEAAGEQVMLTRESDVYVGLSERAVKANKYGADYLVSFHENSFAKESTKGTEVYCYSRGGQGEKLAYAVLSGLVSNDLVVDNRGVKTANFAVLRETNMPAILVEGDFISNNATEIKMMQEDWREAEASAIAQACLRFIGKDLTGNAPISKPVMTTNDAKETWELFVQGDIAKRLQLALNSVYGAGLVVDGYLGDVSWNFLEYIFLTKGTKNQVVGVVQERLMQLGYSLPVYGADGWYGDETIAAIKSRQNKYNMIEDGICGPDTFRALYRIIE